MAQKAYDFLSTLVWRLGGLLVGRLLQAEENDAGDNDGKREGWSLFSATFRREAAFLQVEDKIELRG